MSELRCFCGKKLGDWNDGRLVITKVGIIVYPGSRLEWCCTSCGAIRDVDLRVLVHG